MNDLRFFFTVISFTDYYCEGYTETHFSSTLKSLCPSFAVNRGYGSSDSKLRLKKSGQDLR